MAQMSSGPVGGDAGPRGDDLYTVLIVVATAFVWVAAIFAMVRAVWLFGSLLPPSGG
jgi:hypothetical protein